MTCSTDVTTPMRKPIDQDACGVTEEDEGKEKRNGDDRVEMVTSPSANLLRFALQAGLYRA
ncbi:hypothetical protein ACFW0H_14925 [Pseudomonas sp. CR3202]|uniref:hypothetical protein n=1 Tax=Pseudomonas sp. CR3202 TaxID=3351532 RepID=UPI003BF24176